MGLLDNIGSTFNKVANTTIQKSKDLTELTKLSLKLNADEGELTKLYEEFGKYQYNFSKGVEVEAKDYVALIDEKLKMIEETKNEIELVKGVLICPKCGTKNKTEDTFCSNCGAKLPKQAPEQAQAEPDADKAEDKAEKEEN